MKRELFIALKMWCLSVAVLSLFVMEAQAQMAIAPKTQPFGKEAFGKSGQTVIRWLGGAGFFINSRGTCIMLDPVLKGFDIPLLIDMPIKPEEVPHLDAILITHSDNDHFSVPSCQDLSAVCDQFHSTVYVDSLMKNHGWKSSGHAIGDTFSVKNIRVKLTPTDHLWPNHFPGSTRLFTSEDFCGFWLETPDGNIWMPSDSRLMPEHLQMPVPDAILFDFSDSKWHIGLEGAVKLADTYPNTPLLLCHWGTVNAPEMPEFNGNPEGLKARVKNPERVIVLAPGEAFILKK